LKIISNVRKIQNQHVDLSETASNTHKYPANDFGRQHGSITEASAYLNIDFQQAGQ
jgi:hypothetical protein